MDSNEKKLEFLDELKSLLEKYGVIIKVDNCTGDNTPPYYYLDSREFYIPLSEIAEG